MGSRSAAMWLAALAIQCLLMAGSGELVQARRRPYTDAVDPFTDPLDVTPDMCSVILQGFPNMKSCCQPGASKICPPYPPEIVSPCCRIWLGGVQPAPSGDNELEKTLGCVHKFYQLASRPETARTARVPMECCELEAFAAGCARLGSRMERVVRAQMLAESQWRRDTRYTDLLFSSGGGGLEGAGLRSPTCSRRQVRKCCGDRDGALVGSLTRALAKHEGQDRNLLTCTINLFMNIIKFKLEVPDVCCSVIIFKIFPKCWGGGPQPSPSPAPIPWPTVPPGPPKYFD